MNHELKTWPEFFKPLWSGEKTFELRKDDRGFRAGDILHLREWSKTDGYTGRSLVATATYVLSGMGLRDNYVVIALSHLTSAFSGPAATDAIGHKI